MLSGSAGAVRSAIVCDRWREGDLRDTPGVCPESPENGTGPCPTCGEDLGALKRTVASLRTALAEAKRRAAVVDLFHGMSQGELLKEQRRAIRYLKKECRSLREALGRTGTREDIYRIIEICRQSANRQSRERMDRLVERLAR